uniref:Vacuolar protein sorting-associated protein 11 homolog n=2 Tax=Hirondellea gigas TaxID=1518452 RepID=A0A6A7FRX4_9CRUS
MGSLPVLQWRKFEFVDIEEGADNGVLDGLLKGNSSVTCVCNGRGLVFVGDSSGYVHSLSRSLHSPVPSYPAHETAIVFLWAADSSSVLLTMAHCAGECSEIKVWAPDRIHEEQPILLRVLRPDSRPPPPRNAASAALPPAPRVTAVSVHPNVNMLALGFSCGSVMLYRGDLAKDRERGSTSRVIVTLSPGITNLHFHLSTQTYTAHAPSRSRKGGPATTPAVSVQTTSLLVTTDNNVYYIACTQKDKESTREVDSVGCRSGCSALADGRNDNLFVLARDDAIYSYSSEGRAGCYVFPGTKQRLFCHRGYAVVTTAAAATAAGAITVSSKSVCTMYDLSNKLIAASFSLPAPLLALLQEWGALYGVCASNSASSAPSMLLFREKDLHTKMEILFKKNQYDVAVSLAKGQSVSGEGVAEILKQYGDWLYSKGDLTMAVHQYIKTIPYLEPSYVIKKFLSSEHMALLAEYLEALHARNLHSPDHSSLLLNCYTRNKHHNRIQAFIQKHSEQVTHAKKLKESHGSSRGCGAGRCSTFSRNSVNNAINSCCSQFSSSDVEVLVSVCRESGFYEEALQLTSLHALHSLHLELLCNDTKQHLKAVLYIRSLSFESACEQMVAHGAVLARSCPDETLELLIELATDYTPDNTPIVGEASLDTYLSSKEPECAAPELFESVVCSDSLLAIRYIEGVTKRQAQQGKHQPVRRLYEMLLAEYLHQLEQAEEGVVREAWEHKVLGIISEPRHPVDPSLACLLCDRHKYPQGKLLIWLHHRMYSEMLQYHMSIGDDAALVSLCEAEGTGSNRALWLTALRLLTSPHIDRPRDQRALQAVLARVDEFELLPAMEVIDLLSACGNITLGDVRVYLTRLADREEAVTAAQQTIVDDYVKQSESIRGQIDAIQSSGVVFTDSKCDVCKKELEFPTVHFFCKHSFHQHCFVSYCSSSEDECPVCLPRHNEIRDALKTQASDRANVVSFGETEADDSNERASECDVFQQLSEYLARGLFTDYSAALAAQTVHLHTPATKAARRQRDAAAAAALESSHSSYAATESRLRLKESRPHAALGSSTTSEGRLRQAASARLDTLGTEGEGRIRAQEPGKGSNITSSSSEARLRQQQLQSRGGVNTVAEGRVRATDSPSSVTVPQAEARLRTQGNKFGSVASSPGVRSKPSSPARGRSPFERPSPTSLHDQITVTGPAPLKPMSRGRYDDASNMESISAAVANSRAKVKLADTNPFESEAGNPFGDDFETEDSDNNAFAGGDKSPFKNESKDDLNPFGDGNDYDSNLNPFGE